MTPLSTRHVAGSFAVPALRCAPLCLAAVMSLSGGLAAAQQSPYYAGVSEVVNRDSNLFRAAKGTTTESDSYSATGIRLGLDQSFGRQRWAASLDANANRFSRHKDLNNNDYALSTQLDWSTIERLSGTVSAGARQSLYRYDRDTTGLFTDRNIQRSRNLGLQMQLGVVTDLSFDAGVSANQDRFSAANFSNRNVNQVSYNGGLRLRPGSGLSLRAGLRHSDGRYANASTTGEDKTRRNDVDFSGVIEASGASTLNARLSRTRLSHSLATLADTKGWTGGLGWNWRPTGKLGMDLNLTRDNSLGATSFDSQLLSVSSSDTRVQNSVGLRVNWEASAAWRVATSLSYAHRTLDNHVDFNNGSATSFQTATDRTVAFSLGLRYLPVRNVELGCNVGREDRATDSPPVSSGGITFGYAVTTASCFGQLFLR
jgi:hypothetical protein